MMRGMTVTNLAVRAMEVTVHELGIAQYKSQYVEEVSEKKRLADLADALVVKNRREDLVELPPDINARVRTENGVLYASSRSHAGLLGWIGRVS